MGPQTNVRSSPERRGRPSSLGRQQYQKEATTRRGVLGWAGREGQEREPLERNGGGWRWIDDAAPTIRIGPEYDFQVFQEEECYLGLEMISEERRQRHGRGRSNWGTNRDKRNGNTGGNTRHAPRDSLCRLGQEANKVFWTHGRGSLIAER